MTTSIRLPRATPAEKGVDPAGILAFLDEVAAGGLELHSFMLFRGGAVVAEGFWRLYGADRVHMQHSATKSWTAAAVGLAIGEGRFGLDDKVIGFFPDQLPADVGDNLAAMTVRDLLTMRSGHSTGISGGEWRSMDSSWVEAFLREPVEEAPGRTFIYSSASSYMLSAIVPPSWQPGPPHKTHHHASLGRGKGYLQSAAHRRSRRFKSGISPSTCAHTR